MTSALIRVAESGILPDAWVRVGIRRLLRRRLVAARGQNWSGASPEQAPLAIDASRANAQHYEVPASFFELMLGPRLKYSCGHWSAATRTLAEAEAEMLALTCERAGLTDGMRVLDLGCGWGAASLWLAERHRASRILAVSNSESQIAYIRRRAAAAGLSRLEAIRADINEFSPTERFDRVLSVEMFEHVRNHARLISRIDSWLAPGGALFVHLFCHDKWSYPFEVEGDDDWMARHFFTGGIMPSFDLLSRVARELTVTRHWRVNGTHYQRTLLAWLARLDAGRPAAERILAARAGGDEARLQFVRWRLFLLACAELFGFRGGEEWLVGHYLLERPR